MNQSIHQSISQSISQSINQSINPSINPSVNQSIHPSINQPINQPINQLTLYVPRQVPQLRKRTLVTLGSEKNMWRLKSLTAVGGGAARGAPGVGSLHSLSVSKKDLARPLYRKDIFYSGSVLNIPQFQSQPDLKSYITSITTIPGEAAFVSGGESKVGCVCLFVCLLVYFIA